MTDAARTLDALIRLGIARQAPPDGPTQQVYLEGLVNVPAEIVERACRELALTPRDEFSTAFPSLGTLLETCKAVRERVGTPKLLREAKPVPLTKAEASAWLAKFRADVAAARR